MTVQTASPKVATLAARYIAAETLLGIVINILMAGLVAALTNRAEAFNGATLAYVASDMAKATIIPTRHLLTSGTSTPPTAFAAATGASLLRALGVIDGDALAEAAAIDLLSMEG